MQIVNSLVIVGPMVFNYSTQHCSVKAITDNTEANGSVCVLGKKKKKKEGKQASKLCLQKQVEGWIWPEGCSLLTLSVLWHYHRGLDP